MKKYTLVCICVCVCERERERERERQTDRVVCVCRVCVCVSVVCARAYKRYHKLFAARIAEDNVTFVAIQTPQCHKLFQRELQFAYVPVDAEA
jgi:hypothetical protein